MTTILAFTLDQTARLTGLSHRQLRYWDDTGFFHPSYADDHGVPFGRVYSFRDVVALRTIALLRRKYGVSLQELRKLGAWLDEHYDEPWSSLRFYISGRQIFFEDPEVGLHRAGRRPEQSVIPIEMEPVAAEMETRARALQRRTGAEVGQIVRHRFVSHNAPVVAGTRVRTEAIWRFHEAGYTTEEIVREYPRLTPQDVEAAIAFERERRQRIA
ncbi:MAG: DUF433 domain-containing protein [Thermomicrobiaceae bacterium]|nr:DUF433 domain-containing protein [Thermomicrobiaceae bacterium]